MIRLTLFRYNFFKNTSLHYPRSTVNDIVIKNERIQMIRKHPPLTQYPVKDLNQEITIHNKNNIRFIKDPQTNIKFLIEQSGFPSCSDLNVCLKLGTQNETNLNSGSLQYLKNYVHIKQTFNQSIKNYEFLQQTGSSFNFDYDVTTSSIKCSFFQEDCQIMLDLLLDLAIKSKTMFEDNFQTVPIYSNISQLVRRTAYGHQGIGMPSTGKGDILTNKQFLKFQQQITPHNMVIGIANIRNQQNIIQLIKSKIKSKYPQFLKRKLKKTISSSYKGGLQKYQCQQQQFFQFALAFPSASFKDTNMELFNILRILLGSASSFSSGGPGKGMHSRCTNNLLNRIHCVENCSFINQHFINHGIFGLTVGGIHQANQDIINCTLEQFKRLQILIPQQQLQRAKNILIASISSNIQRQSDRLQQLCKQIFCYEQVKLDEFQHKIRAITSYQIQNVMKKMFKQKPTFVLRGNQTSLKLTVSQQSLLKKLQI